MRIHCATRIYYCGGRERQAVRKNEHFRDLDRRGSGTHMCGGGFNRQTPQNAYLRWRLFGEKNLKITGRLRVKVDEARKINTFYK